MALLPLDRSRTAAETTAPPSTAPLATASDATTSNVDARDALQVPMGPSAPVAQASRSQPVAQAPSLLAGLVRPAVFAVVLGLGLAAGAEAASAQGRQGAPLTPTTISVQVKSPDAAIDSAFARILAADVNGDGKVHGGRWQPETTGLDSLSAAVFAYVDQVNPRGNYSLWGGSSRGDYQVGGLGLGYATRPAHMTGNEILLKSDLEQGIRELKRALASPRADLLGQDYSNIVAERRAAGDSVSATDVHAATERLLDVIKHTIEQKERATGREVVQLLPEELLAKLDAGSLERTIAETTMGHGKTFYGEALKTIDARRRAFGSAVHDEGAIVGDAQQNYLLQLSKAAKEESILVRIRAALPR